ncbi:MAG: tRNA (N(6)-L-threonylcarbamoyladenosine(37)-C(2))-methylthiotransferase MtaB [Candidatus Improbicoccus devescovinae]|nr:MAG: tRNA (N(6)-L-threonylcarbamoyladenosine(37)-C(2))-methylthiotransferase MtaB [Candidatus Improbicoccus devescovinae]
MNFFIKTLGCKVNNCDSDIIIKNLVLNKLININNIKLADIIIINSCAVTAESVRKTRQVIRKYRRMAPEAVIVLTGCSADIIKKEDNNEILTKIDIIISNFEKFNILKILKNHKILGNYPVFLEDINKLNINTRSRAFLKIEEGCENFCSYCIIPYLRGPVKSKSLEDIQKEAYELKLNNFTEIVLVGINLCAYGTDININLIDAIEVVNKFFSRIRLGSLDPYFFIDNNQKNNFFLEYITKNKNICPSFHLSLQSGSNKILEKMNRKYTRENYIKITEKIKNNIPNSTITTDVIIGFPGETEEDFKKTVEIIEYCNFLKVNVFPFSARIGTAAYSLDNKIDEQTKKIRVKKILEISDIKSRLEINKFINQEFNVMFEKTVSENIYSGYTENYIKIHKYSAENLYKKTEKIILTPEIILYN